MHGVQVGMCSQHRVIDADMLLEHLSGFPKKVGRLQLVEQWAAVLGLLELTGF